MQVLVKAYVYRGAPDSCANRIPLTSIQGSQRLLPAGIPSLLMQDALRGAWMSEAGRRRRMSVCVRAEDLGKFDRILRALEPWSGSWMDGNLAVMKPAEIWLRHSEEK